MKSIQDMTIKEKLGQLLFVGFDGYQYNEHLRVLVEEYKVANVILFARNIQNIEQLSTLNRLIHQEIMKHTQTMPLIAIDQEGGLVTRIMSGATFCPGAMTLAATNETNAHKIGEIMGEELAHLGINMNLAPDLDVNNNPKNPVIGVRSYSDNPRMVANFGKAFIKGFQSKGLIATAKHFPGHGDVEVDSHLGLPVVDYDKSRLEQIELFPFVEAIKDGIDAIMSAHIIFKAYEPLLPATLSRPVLTDLLRHQLGFDGLIVSDCMEMKAISDHYTTEKGTVLGIIAGLDMAFISHTLEKQIKALQLLEEAYNNQTLSTKALDEKVERILRYKAKVYPTIESKFINQFNGLDYFKDPSSKDFAQSIVDQSLTMITGKRFYLGRKTLLVATQPFATTIVEDQLDTRNIIDAIKREIPEIDCKEIKLNEIDESILDIIGEYDCVVVCSYNASVYRKQAQLIQLIHQRAKELHVISVRNPYDYLVFKDIKNVVTLYEYTPNSVRTIVRYLKGTIKPQGKCPIQLNKPFTVGASVYVGLKDYPLEQNIHYLKQLKRLNVKRIFVSAHMNEAGTQLHDELVVLLEQAKALQIDVILDVSKPALTRLGIPKNIYSLRLDWGFSVADIIELLKEDFLIELNASVITKEELLYLKSRGVDFSRLRISHNFYPKPYTALSHEDVLAKNTFYKQLGMSVMAYIPSQTGKRPPLYEGLPTIEVHRHMDLIAILADMNLLMVDEVFFGDAYCSEEEIITAQTTYRNTLLIPILVYSDISPIERDILSRSQINRIDVNPYFIRSSIREKEPIEPRHCDARDVKMVTIDTHRFARYCGEVSIMKQALPADDRVNVVGVALVSDYLLNHIQPNQTFKFIIRGEIQCKK